MDITGPARGHDLMKTAADPDGVQSLGTWNNCGNGRTPWGTYLACEENFNGYYSSSDESFEPTPHMKRYGVSNKDWGYTWATADERFDISKHPNESNRNGYVVEIDPMDPNSTPKKRTALGRFKHENAEVVIANNGRVVVYMGDDERGEFLYRFVSDGTYSQGGDNANLLENGRLYVAKFDDQMRGEWLELSPATTSMASQAEVSIMTRKAASKVGATTMDRPEWTHFEGSAWYTRFFPAPDLAPGERLFLRIGAANYEARVFLNGRFAGGHRGGSTPFFVELGPHLKDGQNRLQVQVENRRRPDRVPMNHTDWFNYGGFYREVELVAVPDVFIRDFRIALVPDGSFTHIAAEVELSAPADGEARLTVPALGIDAAVPDAAAVQQDVAPLDPDLPEADPVGDGVPAVGKGHVVEARRFRRPQLGPRVKGQAAAAALDRHRGICCHEDDAALGKCTDRADIRRRLEHARELGANCIRLAHYPHHEDVARMADEEGMLLFEEIPVYWAIDFANRDSYADAENQLRELIRRDANRASVVLWGVGNENADTDARLAFMSALAEAARAADPTRLVTAACLIDRRRLRIEDRLAGALDVIGVNEYFGWYEPDFAGLDKLLANSDPDRPVMITECGADAVTGSDGAPGELFSEMHQAHVLETQFATVTKVPYIRGFFPWLLYDFRSERRQTRYQRGYNLKGLIDRDKTRKKAAFDALRRRYEDMSGSTP